nr:MAG TPA: hypothetical protein [Caudoviricetes sp.]
MIIRVIKLFIVNCQNCVVVIGDNNRPALRCFIKLDCVSSVLDFDTLLCGQILGAFDNFYRVSDHFYFHLPLVSDIVFLSVAKQRQLLGVCNEIDFRHSIPNFIHTGITDGHSLNSVSVDDFVCLFQDCFIVLVGSGKFHFLHEWLCGFNVKTKNSGNCDLKGSGNHGCTHFVCLLFIFIFTAGGFAPPKAFAVVFRCWGRQQRLIITIWLR